MCVSFVEGANNDSNDNRYKCCCGCMTLNQATWLIGFLYLIAAMLLAIATSWISMAYALIVASLFFVIVAKPDSVSLRKCIYYTYLTSLILGLIGYIILIIFVFIYHWAPDDDEEFDDWGELSDWFEDSFIWWLWMIFLIVFSCSMFIPCSIAGAQVLYYGWKEQEAL